MHKKHSSATNLYRSSETTNLYLHVYTEVQRLLYLSNDQRKDVNVHTKSLLAAPQVDETCKRTYTPVVHVCVSKEIEGCCTHIYIQRSYTLRKNLRANKGSTPIYTRCILCRQTDVSGCLKIMLICLISQQYICTKYRARKESHLYTV